MKILADADIQADTPFEQYVASIAGIYSATDGLRLSMEQVKTIRQTLFNKGKICREHLDLLGVSLPQGISVNVSGGRFGQVIQELDHVVNDLQLWLQLIIESINTVDTFISLYAPNKERLPVLIDWNGQGSALVRNLQINLAEGSPNAPNVLAALKAHIEVHRLLISEFKLTEDRLEKEVQYAEKSLAVNREKLESGVSLGAFLRQRAWISAAWGGLIGLLLCGFGGCFYGCVASSSTAKDGTLGGGLLGALIFCVIGYLIKLDDIQGTDRDIAVQRVDYLDAQSRLNDAHSQLINHRALRPHTLQLRS